MGKNDHGEKKSPNSKEIKSWIDNVGTQKWPNTNVKIPIRVQKRSITKLKYEIKQYIKMYFLNKENRNQNLELYAFQERNLEELEWK